MKNLSPLVLAVLRKMLIPILTALGGAAAVGFSGPYRAFCSGLI